MSGTLIPSTPRVRHDASQGDMPATIRDETGDLLGRMKELERRVVLYLSNTSRVLGTITVVAEKDEIHLSGELPSFYLRQLAVACAQRVAGVRNVVDQLKVDDEGQPPRRPALAVKRDISTAARLS